MVLLDLTVKKSEFNTFFYGFFNVKRWLLVIVSLVLFNSASVSNSWVNNGLLKTLEVSQFSLGIGMKIPAGRQGNFKGNKHEK